MSITTAVKEGGGESGSGQTTKESIPARSVKEVFSAPAGVVLLEEDVFLGPSKVVAEHVGEKVIIRLFAIRQY